jgi:hypothetical protein
MKKKTTRAPNAGFVISSEEDERRFVQYVALRDQVRQVLGGGVYPNLVKALEVYAAFDTALDEGGALADAELSAYNAALMGPIAPYIAELRAAAAGIVATMQAIETASPGTFGIALPNP